MPLKNETLQTRTLLAEMYADGYFPNHLVDKGKDILLRCCEEIEAKQPSSLAELYAITHKATESFNALAEEFYEHDSEIETGARESIAIAFGAIADAYGFADADLEELIAPRDW